MASRNSNSKDSHGEKHAVYAKSEVQSCQTACKSRTNGQTGTQIKENSNDELKSSTRKKKYHKVRPTPEGSKISARSTPTAPPQERAAKYTQPEPLPESLRNRKPRRKRKFSDEVGFDGQPSRGHHRHSWQAKRELEYRAYQLGISVDELNDSS